MDPFVLWVTGAIVSLGAFTGWLIRWAITHLESDLAYSRKSSQRGASVAEKAADVAERSV